ncbi:Mu transposase C-terminal domain-containing protein [Nonomuraea wenchangensis]|uniref:Mu transposase C-terminal domain-containing protein n=1 Tax=Nonomuraea wenchangensis TaxID=568860 RepID=UPI003406017B
MPPADREARQAAVERLCQLRAAGDLTAEHVRLAAAGLNLSERSMWRLLSDGTGGTARPRGPAPYELSETDREAYAYYGANIAAVHRARAAVLDGQTSAAGVPIPEFLRQGWAGAEPVTLRTLQRTFTRALLPAERAGWSSGEQARREADVYLVRPAAHRNQIWEADHKKLPILVLPPRGPAVCPWLTTIVDDGTRALLGWALALTPHAGTVLTALRMALVCDAERGPFGAIPALVRIDRGLEFAAAPVREALAALCVQVLRLPARQPHRKGKIERLHRTMDQTLLSGLPGFTEGPRDAAGALYGPLDDRAAARAAAPEGEVQPMRIERFAAHFASWAAWYNTMRPHSALDGRTPVQAWNDDPSALARIGAERLRHLLLAGVERTVGKDGVRLHGLAYVAPELQGRRGQQVQVRYMPHDDRFIEVYLDGEHLCTAHPQGQLTDEQVEAFREHARQETKRLNRQRRKAGARTRAELAPLTDADNEPAQARLLPAAALTDQARRRADSELTRRSRSDLLGLRPVRAIPPEETP